jgi:hypothetical protein
MDTGCGEIVKWMFATPAVDGGAALSWTPIEMV